MKIKKLVFAAVAAAVISVSTAVSFAEADESASTTQTIQYAPKASAFCTEEAVEELCVYSQTDESDFYADELFVMEMASDNFTEEAAEIPETERKSQENESSPDTGVESIAVVAGFAVISGGLMMLTGRKK